MYHLSLLARQLRVNDTVVVTDPEPPQAVERPTMANAGRHAFLYAATCPTLRRWSSELGFDVAQIGVSLDPLRSVAALNGHGAMTYFAHPFDENDGPCAWQVAPLAPVFGAALPEGCRPWAGTIRVELPPGADLADLAGRLAIFLAPLDAMTCAAAPSALRARHAAGRFLPVMPRYTAAPGGARLVRDLYRLNDAHDRAYVAEALWASLHTLGPERGMLDRALTALSGAPGGGEHMRAEVG